MRRADERAACMTGVVTHFVFIAPSTTRVETELRARSLARRSISSRRRIVAIFLGVTS
jgi:hypothetical protein